jgi:endonuclease IV
MIIGFSTGDYNRTKIKPISKEVIEHIKNMGCNAIELNCGSLDRISDLANIDREDLQSFSHVSLHAPNKVTPISDNGYKIILDAIQEAHDRLQFDVVVLHPDPIEKWEDLMNYNLPIAVENMDSLRSLGKSIEDIKAIVEKYDLKVVVDINHIFTNDITMQLHSEFMDALGDRVVEFHLSGYADFFAGRLEGNFLHYPLYRMGQDNIIKVIHNKKIPIIIESELIELADAKKELKYIKDNLK